MSPLVVAAVATVVVDATSKQLVTARLVEGRLYALAPGFGLRRVHNRRGNLARLSVSRAVVVWVVIVGCIGLALALAPTGLAVATAAGLGMSVGGAAGNLADRLVRGAVVDFVAAGRWPVFNMADAAIVAGLVLTLGTVLL